MFDQTCLNILGRVLSRWGGGGYWAKTPLGEAKTMIFRWVF